MQSIPEFDVQRLSALPMCPYFRSSQSQAVAISIYCLIVLFIY